MGGTELWHLPSFILHCNLSTREHTILLKMLTKGGNIKDTFKESKRSDGPRQQKSDAETNSAVPVLLFTDPRKNTPLEDMSTILQQCQPKVSLPNIRIRRCA